MGNWRLKIEYGLLNIEDELVRLIHALLVALIAVLIASSARADELPLLHPLFSDHGVLQRGRAVPVRSDDWPGISPER